MKLNNDSGNWVYEPGDILVGNYRQDTGISRGPQDITFT